MCDNNDSFLSFLNPFSSISSDRFSRILFIFSESLEYLPKSIINKITINTKIGNITSYVTEYAFTNRSNLIFLLTPILQAFSA